MKKKLLIAFALLSTSCVFIVSKEDKPEETNQAVSYRSVELTPSLSELGYQLNVKIALTVNQALPNVAPHIEVIADCQLPEGNSAQDKENAFFSSLSNATPGTQREDTAQLFFAKELKQPPTQCALTLQPSEGDGSPKHFCFKNNKTTPGDCPKPH